MNPKSQDSYTQAYNRWIVQQSPENLADLVATFSPTINAEIQQYAGSKELLRARAKAYVVQAIRTYDPFCKTNLNSWVITNLKQLSRYGKKLRPIHVSEDMARHSAELNRVTAELEDTLGRKPTDEELQDQTGWSPREIKRIRAASVASVTSGNAAYQDDDDQGPEEPAIKETDKLPYVRDMVYASLSDRDKAIFDYKLGLHGKSALTGKQIADKLHVTPAYISQRSSGIGSLISEFGN